MVTKLVVGIDGSDGSRAALHWAAQRVGREIHAVFAFSPGVELLVAGIQIDTTHALDRARERLRSEWIADAGIPIEDVRSHVIEDSPARALIDIAHRLDAGAIVVGASGHTHVAGLVGGNVGRLIHLSDIPVVVVPSSPAPSSNDSESRVVVGISGQPWRDRRLVDWARTAAAGHPLQLVHALPPDMEPSRNVSTYDPEVHALEDIDRLLDRAGPDDRGKVVYDDPISALIGPTSDGASLIVIGTHHSTRLGGFLTGAIAQHLPAVSPCPVALIPLESPAA